MYYQLFLLSFHDNLLHHSVGEHVRQIVRHGIIRKYFHKCSVHSLFTCLIMEGSLPQDSPALSAPPVL